MANTIIDGGGKVMSSTVLKSNTTYQNWIIQGGTQFLSNGASVSNVKILNCTFKNCTGMNIFIGNYAATGGASSNIEVANCTMSNFSNSQYYWEFQNCSALLIHDNKFTNGTGSGDGGVIYLQYSSGQFYNMFCDTFHGKFIRFWPQANSVSNVYNIIAMNSDMYSAFEIQETPGVNPNGVVYFDNCSVGNFPLAAGIPTGAITVYLPSSPAPTVKYYFGSSKFNIVFNTTTGLLDNGGNKIGPWAPQNANWATVNKYYATMQAAGWVNDAAVTLPDGTQWNGATPPPVNQPPIAKIGTISAITLPANSVTLDGTGSTDPDGTVAGYAWSLISGTSNPTLSTPSASKCAVSGLIAGTYVFGLTVTDNQGATNSSSVTVLVNAAVVPVPGPAKTITDVQTVTDANGIVLAAHTYVTNL